MAPNVLSGKNTAVNRLETRSQNRKAHPGLIDANRKRRSTEEVQKERQGKHAEALAKARSKDIALAKLTAFEKATDQQQVQSNIDANHPPSVRRSTRSQGRGLQAEDIGGLSHGVDQGMSVLLSKDVE